VCAPSGCACADFLPPVYSHRDALFYLDTVRCTSRTFVFMTLLLPWFVVCFWEAWCPESSCQANSTYKTATDVMWKVLVCCCLFTLANFLKSILTKLLSGSFYRTAHVKKVWCCCGGPLVVWGVKLNEFKTAFRTFGI
jgi:hypothetical protein